MGSICAVYEGGWMDEDVHRLSRAEKSHNLEQIYVAQNQRFAGPTDWRQRTFKDRSTIGLSPIEGEGGGYPQDGISNSLRALRVLGNVVQTYQCPCDIHGRYE
jgi:hypothetical protein